MDLSTSVKHSTFDNHDTILETQFGTWSCSITATYFTFTLFL
jgi:hypothetical protein